MVNNTSNNERLDEALKHYSDHIESLQKNVEEITSLYPNEASNPVYQNEVASPYMETNAGIATDINEDGPFSSLTEDEIKEVLDLYKKFVAAKSEALAKQIAADEDLQKQYKHLKFTEAVINDRIQVIENPDDKKPAGNRAQRRAVSKQIKHQISKQKQKADIKKGKK